MNIRLIRNTSIALAIGSLALSACQDLFTFSTSSCDGVEVTDYLVKDIRLSTSNIQDIATSDAPSEFPNTLSNTLFNFDFEYDTHITELSKTGFNFSIIPKAIACSIELKDSPVAQINYIEITSNEISLTDNLNSDFNLYSVGSSNYAEKKIEELFTIHQYSIDDNASNFKLVNQSTDYDPSISTASFHFKITMDNGAIYNLHSDQITL